MAFCQVWPGATAAELQVLYSSQRGKGHVHHSQNTQRLEYPRALCHVGLAYSDKETLSVHGQGPVGCYGPS